MKLTGVAQGSQLITTLGQVRINMEIIIIPKKNFTTLRSMLRPTKWRSFC